MKFNYSVSIINDNESLLKLCIIVLTRSILIFMKKCKVDLYIDLIRICFPNSILFSRFDVSLFQNVCPCSSHHLPQAGPHRRQERQARPYVPGIDMNAFTFSISIIFLIY